MKKQKKRKPLSQESKASGEPKFANLCIEQAKEDGLQPEESTDYIFGAIIQKELEQNKDVDIQRKEHNLMLFKENERNNMALVPMNMDNKTSIRLFGKPKDIAEELLDNIERIQSGDISMEALKELDINQLHLGKSPGVGKTVIATYLGQEMVKEGWGMSIQ